MAELSLPTAAVYVRVSTEEQAAEGLSVPAQIETLTNYCQAYNIRIYKIYEDLGISGKDTINRPALIRLIEDSSRALFNTVLVWKISRLSRSLKDLLQLIDIFEKNSITFTSYSEKFDTSTPVGRMTLQLLGSIAEFERNTIVENVKLGLKEYARRGGKTGSVLGYANVEKKLVINQKESESIRMIFDLYVNSGLNFNQIADYLNEHGIVTKRGNQFRSDGIALILRNPVYIGVNRFNTKSGNVQELKGAHEPIIDRFTWAKAQHILKSKTRKRKSSTSSDCFLLNDMVRCPVCGNCMSGYYTLSDKKKYRYYKCNSHGSKGFYIDAEILEIYVVDSLKELFSQQEISVDLEMYLKRRYYPSFAAPAGEINSDTIKRLSRLLKEYTDVMQKELKSGLAESSMKAKTNFILEEIHKLESEIHTLSSKQQAIPACLTTEAAPLLERLRSELEQMDRKALKALIQELIESITIGDEKGQYKINFRFPVENRTE